MRPLILAAALLTAAPAFAAEAPPPPHDVTVRSDDLATVLHLAAKAPIEFGQSIAAAEIAQRLQAALQPPAAPTKP